MLASLHTEKGFEKAMPILEATLRLPQKEYKGRYHRAFKLVVTARDKLI